MYGRSALMALVTVVMVVGCDRGGAVEDPPTIDPLAAHAATHTQAGEAITPVTTVAVDTAPERIVCGDEIDQLAQRLEPPQRYAMARPNWRVEERTFTFAHRNGERTSTWQLVFDGERLVALRRSGDIQLIARTPDDAPTRVALPTERFHLDTMLGPSLPTWGFLKRVKTHGSIYEEMGDRALIQERWERSDDHLALVLTQELPGQVNDVRFIFTCDPVYGYRIDAVYDIHWDQRPSFGRKARLPAGTFTPGCYVPWSYQAWFDRTVYTPGGGGIKGWANNLVTMDRCDRDHKAFSWRDGGYIAYLPGPESWSPCFTRQDGGGTTSKLRVCNAHNDFHITIPLEQVELEQKADGTHRLYFVHRLLHLPPELTAHVWDAVELICQNQHSLVISLGEVEDFEDQPTPLTEAARGLVWTSHAPEIVTGNARSGERSIRISSRAWPNLPQVSLLPGVTYRLEGWYRIEPWGEERVAAARTALAQKDAEHRARLRKQGHPLPPPVDWQTLEPGASIGADYYEWSPYSNPMLTYMRTDRALASRDGWQHVSLDFTAPEWGPFVNIHFDARMCDALLDDFALRIIALSDGASAAPAGAGR
ncbi:MAG: hypothetical protein ACOCZK_02000 [Planctomycetota bacterium]